MLKRIRRWTTRSIGGSPLLRRVVEPVVAWRHRGDTWMRPHPFDVAHGVVTTGFVPGWLLGSGRAHEDNLGYGGCQPSCVRRVLESIPDPAAHRFVDIGCGKGRALVVASEFPFARVLGVEIDAALCEAARGNAAAIGSRFPARVPIEVVEGDALRFALPPGGLVVFIYNAFTDELLHQVVGRLLDAAGGRSLFVIYAHPAFGHVLDAEPRLRRWFAATVPRTPEEVGVGSGADDTAVCWVLRSDGRESLPGAGAAIVVDGGAIRLE